jgi:hypothetical protein
MISSAYYRAGFAISAAYDVILGLLFFAAFRPAFAMLGIAGPDSPVYVQATAAFVFVQGIGYLFVYVNPARNVDIVRLGIVYKIVYASLSFIYWGMGTLPHPVFAIFGIIDLGFVVFFIGFLRAARSSARP